MSHIITIEKYKPGNRILSLSVFFLTSVVRLSIDKIRYRGSQYQYLLLLFVLGLFKIVLNCLWHYSLFFYHVTN